MTRPIADAAPHFLPRACVYSFTSPSYVWIMLSLDAAPIFVSRTCLGLSPVAATRQTPPHTRPTPPFFSTPTLVETATLARLAHALDPRRRPTTRSTSSVSPFAFSVPPTLASLSTSAPSRLRHLARFDADPPRLCALHSAYPNFLLDVVPLGLRHCQSTALAGLQLQQVASRPEMDRRDPRDQDVPVSLPSDTPSPPHLAVATRSHRCPPPSRSREDCTGTRCVRKDASRVGMDRRGSAGPGRTSLPPADASSPRYL
ncbi:hypothetical protein B0H17DRAFT_1211239 [Mycena rosella]|uniref:Uncharacterized protein n=1 Tax=Mycena rosella TaxID=1033263 RepID=A0AAD7CUI2_MYCRO|nr:hypothetical protein B0H17DRAFT_1211239 [Mycena rosella]